jgi:hypothetical protein
VILFDTQRLKRQKMAPNKKMKKKNSSNSRWTVKQIENANMAEQQKRPSLGLAAWSSVIVSSCSV